MSEIGGDISKFASVPKLVAFAELYPQKRQSGESINSIDHLSKRGSPYLRRAIWLASFVAAFKDPAIHQFYEHKHSEGKDHLNAIGHVCHKILSIIFAVLRDNKPYVPISTCLFIAGLFFIEQQKAIVCIPDKSNFKVKHDFDKELYKQRNIIERFFQRIKNYRHIAFRFDKLADCFLNFVLLAASVIHF